MLSHDSHTVYSKCCNSHSIFIETVSMIDNLGRREYDKPQKKLPYCTSRQWEN